MIKVIVNGASGRMGQEAVKAISADSDLTLVGHAGRGDNLRELILATQADVVVELTHAESGFKNTQLILEAGARPVVGTSGFRKEQVLELQKLAKSKNLAGLIAPNFAIGAVLMMKFARQAAEYLPEVEIIELHHDGKSDSPSGTAIRTAELILENRGAPSHAVADKPIIPHARGAEIGGIHIHSVRLPGFVAHQRVIFGGKSQSLTIQHDSLHRESFMPGICLACKKVMLKSDLIYGLEHLLD